MSIARKLIPSDSAQVFPFVFKVTTTAANTVFTVPLSDYGSLTPSVIISWGDGTANSPLITSSSSVNRIHTYVSPGTYTITISGFGLAEVVSFNSAFQATKLSSIPSDLFDYSPSATTFSNTFASILTLTSVPNGLFDNVPNATTFSSCFFACTALTSVPSTLFDLNVNATNFSGTFRNCLSLTNVLQFTYNTNVTIFNNVYNMSSTSNALTGTAPELWNRTPTPAGTAAFRNCTGLSNFASIPSTWK